MSEYTKTRKVTLRGYRKQIEVCGQEIKGKGKGKEIPLQAWTGREGCTRSRLLDFKKIDTLRW